MRLINVRTLAIEQFFGSNIPPYTILSHTWGNEEVTFQDWQDISLASSKGGYAKIRGACEQATRSNLDYIWVDTNCIDKTSSAELSEAINSMFAWYRDASVCYAYLADAPDTSPAGEQRRRGNTSFWRSILAEQVVYTRMDSARVARTPGCDFLLDELGTAWDKEIS